MKKLLNYKILLIFLYILAVFGVIGYAVYKKQSNITHPAAFVGGNDSGFTTLSKTKSIAMGEIEWLGQVPLLITVDNTGGIIPDDNVTKNIAAYYKDYQVELGESSNGFFVMPSSTNYLGPSGTTYSLNTPLKFAWNSDNDLCYYSNNSSGVNDWNGAIVSAKVPASMPSQHIFKEELRKLYTEGGMPKLIAGWEALINSNTTTQSQKMWRAVADTLSSGNTSEAINTYMHLGESGETAYDYNKMSQWTETQASESFLDTVDIFMTIVASVKDSPRAYEVWKGILNGYLSDGVRSTVGEATLCKYNIIMSPGVAIADNTNGKGKQILVTGSIDLLNWIYQVEDNYNIGNKVINENSNSKAVVLAAETLGFGENGNDKTNTYLRSAISGSIGSKPLIEANYPFNFGKNIREYVIAETLGSVLHNINNYNNWDTSIFNNSQASIRYLNATSNGVTYYGKAFIIPSPLATVKGTSRGLDATFSVIWNDHQTSFFSTDMNSETVGDEAQLKVRFNIDKDTLPTYLEKLDQYSKYYISFDIVSKNPNNGVTERFSVKPLGEGETNLGGSPNFKINGSYGLKQRIPVSKETLRSLLKGQTTYNAIIDTATNDTGIAPQETQTYGYDLQATIHFGEEGKGADYPSTWSGYSYDKDSASQAKHKVSVNRPGSSGDSEYLTWHSDPEAYAEIKEGYVNYTGTNSVEAFEAMAGVPSTEMLYFASGGSEFIVELQLKLYKGELGIRTYDSYFLGTECEFKHTDAFWPMGANEGTYKYQEDKDDDNTAEGTAGQQGEKVVTGEMKIEKFYSADEYDNDLGGEDRYGTKTLAQGYKWAIPGNDLSSDGGSSGNVSYQIELAGHEHSMDHSNPVGDKNCSSSTIEATYTGTILNKISDNSPDETNHAGNSWFDTFLQANPAPSCQGGFDGKAGDTYKGNDRTKWDTGSLKKAIQSARDWAAEYEKTNATYTAFSTADSDGYTRIWRIGEATINITVGHSGASGSGTLSGSGFSGSFKTSQLTDAWIDSTFTNNSTGNNAAALFGSGHSFHKGVDGTKGEHGSTGGPPVDPHGGDSDGVDTEPSTISQTGTINYTITVKFDNGTLDAHELCGACCQHDLPAVGDEWAQTFQYDYAALNVCRVYKIHRSYLKGGDLEEITFADYGKENSSEAGEHWMYSGPIQNYTIDTGDWGSEGRYPSHTGFRIGQNLSVTNPKRARQVITAKVQGTKHNGTDTIVAAVNQGDPNIFYGIGMMFNIQDGNNRSYAYEVLSQEKARQNKQTVDLYDYSKQTGFAGRVRNSLRANMLQSPIFIEYSQRGDYTNYVGNGSWAFITPGLGWTGPMGSRSNKCDGLSETVGNTNPVHVMSNGHLAPKVTFVENGTKGAKSDTTITTKDNQTVNIKAYLGSNAQNVTGTGNNTQDPWKNKAIPNFSTGILYSRSPLTMGVSNYGSYAGAGNIGSLPNFTLKTDNGGLTLTGDGKYHCTFDEYWMATLATSDDYSERTVVYPGYVETKGGGTFTSGKHKYDGEESLASNLNTGSWAKKGYTYDSVDYFDYVSEEYNRFRYRRNMRNTLYVISDMLILQTSSGDQPVMYHWKSQTKRAQQHYDYVEADVDPNQVKFDGDITGKTILLREEGLDSIWEDQQSSERDATAGVVTRTAAGWGANNVGSPQGVNVGGYLGLYDQPDRKYSSFVNNDRISTLYDGDPYESGKPAKVQSTNGTNYFTGVQGNDTGHRWSTTALATFNETATNFPIILDNHYAKSVANVGALDFGGNKATTAIWSDNKHNGDNLSYVDETDKDSFRNGYSDLTMGPQNLWRYATTVDNLNPDMYKSNAAAHGRNWGESVSQIPAGLRMTRPYAALRIVTDKIQINPTISNGQYDTGEATQTYMKILDYPAVDIGEMNYLDALASNGAGAGTRDIFKSDKNGNVNVDGSEIDERAKAYVKSPVFENVEICITDEDHVAKEGRIFRDGYVAKYPSTKQANGDPLLWNKTNGYEVDAVYSKTHDKINDILIHTPISVEDAQITHNQKAVNENWYADTRTGADDLTTVGLNSFIQKLEKCTGDPDTCQFHILNCKYGSDTLLFSADFNESDPNTVLNKATGGTIVLPSGFTKVNTITQYKRKVSEGYKIERDDPDYKAIAERKQGANESDADYKKRIADAQKDYLDKYKIVQMEDGKWYEVYEGGITNISSSGGANQYGFTATNKTFLSCFGNRFKIPVTVSGDDVIEVDMDFYANWATAGKSMIISFNNYGFVIENPYENKWGFGLGTNGSNAFITDEYRNTIFNSGMKLKLVFDFKDPSQSKLIYNGVEMSTKTVVNNWPSTAPTTNGHLNIGSWDINDDYPAQFWIDNLTVTKLAGERRHNSSCYTYTFEHENAVDYTCGVQQTVQFNPEVNGAAVKGNAIDVDRPYLYTAKESGIYRVEAWGAAGGGATKAINAGSSGGLGGFTNGYIHLAKDESVMIYPGETGSVVQSTGWRYGWTVSNNCYLQGGTDGSLWAKYCQEQGAKGVNWDVLDNVVYTNSYTGEQESPRRLYVLYSETVPPKYSCGAHSISIAMKQNSAGELEMVRKEKGGPGSGGTYTTTTEHRYPYNISPSGTGRYALATFVSPMTGQVTFNVETVNWHANWYAIYEGVVGNSGQTDTSGSIASSDNIHLTYNQDKSKVTANLVEGKTYTFCVISRCSLFTARNGDVSGTVILYETRTHTYPPEPIDTIGGAGFNGGGSGGVNGYGGGGATDIRRLSVGGVYTMNGSSNGPTGAQKLMQNGDNLIYGPYINLTAGTYQVDIYGTTAKSKMGISCAQIDVYDNNPTADGVQILYDTATSGIQDIKRSPTHVSFYFTLKDDHPKVNGGGIEVRLKDVTGASHNDYGFTEMYISKLEDRLIVAGGGGGADNGYTTAVNGGDDGSGGDGGGLEAGSGLVDGVPTTGNKLSSDLSDSAINKRRDSAGRGWRAIDGVARSGCGLGGTQTSGYALGRGETVSYNTDTGGAGGGYYGGYVTNHNNGGAGGGSGYKSSEVTGGVTSTGGNKKQGKLTLQLVEHEHTTATSHAFDYTGSVQTWTVDETGEYLLEAWGAQGGMYESGYEGGKGAYAATVANLTKGQTLYIYVGSKGLSYPDNDGGKLNPTAQKDKNFSYGGAGNQGGGNGGDASDVRTVQNDYNSRLVVAAGGGGGDLNSRPGYGGGLKGGNSNPTATNGQNGLVQTGKTEAKGGTQTSGGRGAEPTSGYQLANGSLGYGGGKTASINVDGGGGGGGYYGGGSGNNGHSGGAGGSSYVGKSKYSRMLDGASVQPGKGMNAQDQTGNSGNGYVKITRVTRGHTEECKTESTQFNVHLHTIDCLYKDAIDRTDDSINDVLKSALKAEFYGDGSQLRQYLGNAVYDALHDSNSYEINSFSEADTKGITTRAYDSGYGTGILYGDESGILHFVPDRTDNWIAIDGTFPTGINKIEVVARFKGSVPSKSTLYYQTKTAGYSESTACNITPANTTDWQTLTFTPNFKSEANRIRIDLNNDNVIREVEIKSIKFSGTSFVMDESKHRGSTGHLTINYKEGMKSTAAYNSNGNIYQSASEGLVVSQSNDHELRLLVEAPAKAVKFVKVTFKIPNGANTDFSMGLAGYYEETKTNWDYTTNKPIGTTLVQKTALVGNAGMVRTALYHPVANTHDTQSLLFYVGDAFANQALTEIWLDAIAGSVASTVQIEKIELFGDFDANSVAKASDVHNYGFAGAGITTKKVGSTTYALVFDHDLTKGYFATKESAINSTANGMYSILALMDSIKASGAYHFRLEYPTVDSSKYNEWTQSVNPINDTTDSVYSNNGAVNDNYHSVVGYNPIHIDWSGNNFGGLTRSIGGNALLDGTTGSPYWWFAIGATGQYEIANHTPGPNSTRVSRVQLWMAVDTSKVNNIASSSGKMQSYTVPEYQDGYYILEAWGANGGDARATNTDNIIQGTGGKGGYTTATKKLNEKETLYLYVGGKGGNTPSEKYSFGQGGWNGGAPGGTELSGEYQPENGAGGGGMSHITYSSTDNLSSVATIANTDTPVGGTINPTGVGAYGFSSVFIADGDGSSMTIKSSNGHMDRFVVVDVTKAKAKAAPNGTTFTTAWLTNSKNVSLEAWLKSATKETFTYNMGRVSNTEYGVYASAYIHNGSETTACQDSFTVNTISGHTYALIAYSTCSNFKGTCTANFTLKKYQVSVSENSNFDKSNVLIVAGGGGGALSYLSSTANTKNVGGNGGGTEGSVNSSAGIKATQTSGYKQGIGKTGYSAPSDYNNVAIAGGGGGWWGGSSVASLNEGENSPSSKGGAGAGGSGYVNTSVTMGGKTIQGSTTNPDKSGNGYIRISKVNPVYVLNGSGKNQNMAFKGASTLVDNPNDLAPALARIAHYLSYNTEGTTKPTVPDTIGGNLNPIYSCYNHPLNYHRCTKNCKYHKVLDCHEPHHEGAHYETTEAAQDAIYWSIKNAELNAVYEKALKGNRQATKAELDAAINRANSTWASYNKSSIRSCYDACNNDANHKHNYDTVEVKGNKIGDTYINTDEYFDIYYPNTGDFEEDPTLHGISYVTNTRGMGYEDDIDTGRFVYPSTSQNYGKQSNRPGYTVNWVRERYVKFNFDVLFYRAETGLWEQYLANRWIEIPVEGNEDNIGYADDTFDKYGHYVTQSGEWVASPSNSTDNGGVFDKTLYGHPLYHFYCTLNNDEVASTPYTFESEAINADSPNGKNKYYAKDTFEYNAGDRGQSGHGVPVYESITNEFLYKTPQDRYDRVVGNVATNKLVPNAVDKKTKVPYHVNDNDNRNYSTNKSRYKNHNADHGATLTKKVDLVGRVGNFMIIYSNDPNYINLFKRADKTKPYIIEGVVYDIFDGIQRDYLSYHYNSGALAYDVRHRQVARNTAYYNTWGSSLFKGASKSDDYADEELAAEKANKNKMSLSVTLNSVGAADNVQAGNDPMTAPLTSGKNNIKQLKKYELTRGYELFYELTSTGNYQNRADVKTYFYALNVLNGSITPVDVWYLSDNKYIGINFFGAADGKGLKGLSVDGDMLVTTPSGGKTAEITDAAVQKMLNSYDININWKKEADLRMYNHMEKALTEYVAQNVKEYYKDDDKADYYWYDVPEGTEPKPVRIPSGEYFRIGNAQALSVYNKGRSFIGTRYTMYEQFRHVYTSEHQVHETNLFDLVDDLEYIWHAQRWHFKLSLPKSAVFVPVTNGVHHHPTEEITTTEYDPNGEKLYYYQLIDHNMQATDGGLVLEKGENDGHYKVFATANIKTIGTVWNLYYTQAKKVKDGSGDKYNYPDYKFDRDKGDQGTINIYDQSSDDIKTYKFETNFIDYVGNNADLSDSQVVLAFFVDTAASITEDGENEVIATH